MHADICMIRITVSLETFAGENICGNGSISWRKLWQIANQECGVGPITCKMNQIRGKTFCRRLHYCKICERFCLRKFLATSIRYHSNPFWTRVDLHPQVDLPS